MTATSNDGNLEHEVLTSEAGQGLMHEVGHCKSIGVVELTRWRKIYPVGFVNAAVRIVETRRRAAEKFSRADRMWFDAVGLEQSTAEIVAIHKANRFAGTTAVIDLCSGIGGDTLAIGQVADVISVDADPTMGMRAKWNAEIYGCEPRVKVVTARAEAYERIGAYVHIDPDRRAASGRRAMSVSDYVPGLDFLNQLIADSEGGGIKLSPASDFAEHFSSHEVELISWNGECKEATVWFGALKSCHRRATRLPTGLTYVGREPTKVRANHGMLADWIYDPDPALVRSGLIDDFAEVHQLYRPFAGVDLLGSKERVETGWLQAFEVDSVHKLDIKTLKKLVLEREIGSLEIKPRGSDIRPEELRKQLRPEGPNAATLFVIRKVDQTQVVVARRLA